VRQPIDEMVEETLALLQLDQPSRTIETGIVRALPGTMVWRDTIPRA
jgi:hypothetical protein